MYYLQGPLHRILCPICYKYDDCLALIKLHTSGFPLPPHLNWHPNLCRLPLRLLTPPLSPRCLLRHRARRLLRRLQRHLLMAKRRNAELAGQRFILLISTRVCPLYLIYSPACSFDHLVVLKQLHPDIGISNKAMAILNSFVNDIFKWIAMEASSKSFSFI